MVRASLVALVAKRQKVTDYVVRNGVYHSNHLERSNHFKSRQRHAVEEKERAKPLTSYPKSSWKGAYDIMSIAREQADVENLDATLMRLDNTQHESSEASDEALFIYISLLRKCVEESMVSEGEKVYAHLVKNGHVTDRTIAHLVMQLFCGSRSARMVYDIFKNIKSKSSMSYSLMITAYAQDGYYREALDLFNDMTVPADSSVYATALYACACLKSLGEGVKIHKKVGKAKTSIDMTLGNSLLNMYTKCGDIESAQDLFRSISCRNATTWNTMITGYIDNGYVEEGLKLFRKMLHEPIPMQPSSSTFTAVLAACGSTKDLNEGEAVYQSALNHRKQKDVAVMTAVLSMYASCGRMEDARAVFDGLENKDVVTWNTMVSGYAQNGDKKSALETYERLLLDSSVQPDRFTFATVLAAATSSERGKRIHRQMQDMGIHPDAMLSNCLLKMYSKFGSPSDARQVFKAMDASDRDVVSWNALIKAYTRDGQSREALEAYKQMDVEPNASTFTAALEACSVAGDLEQGKLLDRTASRSEFGSEMRVQNAVMRMYACCGQVQYAKWEFDRLMTLRDTDSWNTMLEAYVGDGQSERALQLYPEMQLEGVKPDQTTLLAVLKACCHSRLFKEARRHFVSMEDDHDLPIELLQDCILELLPENVEVDAEKSSKVQEHIA